jgi:hypothetical protein
MKTLVNAADRQELLKRLTNVCPESQHRYLACCRPGNDKLEFCAYITGTKFHPEDRRKKSCNQRGEGTHLALRNFSACPAESARRKRLTDCLFRECPHVDHTDAQRSSRPCDSSLWLNFLERGKDRSSYGLALLEQQPDATGRRNRENRDRSLRPQSINQWRR